MSSWKDKPLHELTDPEKAKWMSLSLAYQSQAKTANSIFLSTPRFPTAITGDITASQIEKLERDIMDFCLGNNYDETLMDDLAHGLKTIKRKLTAFKKKHHLSTRTKEGSKSGRTR